MHARRKGEDKMLNVLLYTTQPVLALGLTAAFEEEGDCHLASICSTTPLLLEALTRERIGVLLIEAAPEISAEMLSDIKDAAQGTPIVIWVDAVSTEFGVASLLQADDDAVAYRGLLAQRILEVLGINVHPLARHDDIFLAALEIKIAFGVEFAKIASAKPTSLAQHRPQFFSLPITSSDVGATHQDFAVLIELNLAALEHFANRAFAGAKGMI